MLHSGVSLARFLRNFQSGQFHCQLMIQIWWYLQFLVFFDCHTQTVTAEFIQNFCNMYVLSLWNLLQKTKISMYYGYYCSWESHYSKSQYNTNVQDSAISHSRTPNCNAPRSALAESLQSEGFPYSELEFSNMNGCKRNSGIPLKMRQDTFITVCLQEPHNYMLR